ncbi:MAG: class I SAM-dependent methyltransferase [Candidatus Bathyarchaeia archaeon]
MAGKELSYFETPTQKIVLEDISRFNRVLDVGAGGEGLAARIGKDKVYGIDIRVDEIREVKGKNVECNWVVCDARKLCFKDEAFDLVTVWFTLMYIAKMEDKIKVLSECRRVLRKDGFLDIKDAQINVRKDIFLFNAKFELPNGEVVNAGYGVSGAQKQTLDLLKTKLREIGFKILEELDKKHWFIIKCRRET